MKKKLLLVLLSVPALIFYECKAFDQNPSLTSALPRASSRENNIFLLLSGIGIVPYDADLDTSLEDNILAAAKQKPAANDFNALKELVLKKE